MKRHLACLMLACLIIGCLASPVQASFPLTVELNGAAVECPTDMTVVEGQVMVPLYWAVQQLGVGEIQWNPDTRAITIITGQDYYSIEKLDSYLSGLKNSSRDGSEFYPLPERTKKLVIPSARLREWVLNLKRYESTRQSLTDPLPNIESFDIIIKDVQGSYEHQSVVHSFENHEGHFYLPMDWLEYLFKASVKYDHASNMLSIQAADPEQAKTEIAKIEKVLIPANPEEALKLWGRGEQMRCGALQYVALSPELRKQAQNSSAARQTYWVTGFSSPWVGPISIDRQNIISDTRVEYTISYPEYTSSPPYTTATEKLIVEKLKVNGSEGWYISQVAQSTGYGIIDVNDEFTDIRGSYEFDENIYTNPLSSFFAVKGNMPYYIISTNKFMIMDTENSSQQEFSVDFTKRPLDKDGFGLLFKPDLGRPDISKYRECYQYEVVSGEGIVQYRLYLMDDELWLATMHNDVMWSIYKLVKTDKN